MKTILWLLFWDEDVISVIKVLFQTIPHIQCSDRHCYWFFSRDDYAPSTDSTPRNNCAFKGSNFVCWGSMCSCAGHLWQETCVPFYIAGSQGHSSLSKLILHFDKCAVLSSAQTTDLWLKWQNLSESWQKAENVHSSWLVLIIIRNWRPIKPIVLEPLFKNKNKQKPPQELHGHSFQMRNKSLSSVLLPSAPVSVWA